MEKINSIFAPKAIWPYSQAVIVRKTLYSSGQIWIDTKTWELLEWIEEQTKTAFKNIWEVLKEGGFNLKNVIKTTIYLKNIEDFEIMNKIYETYFSHKPARSCIGVVSLPAWALVEIEVIAKHS